MAAPKQVNIRTSPSSSRTSAAMQRQSSNNLLAAIRASWVPEEIALSTVSVIELKHGSGEPRMPQAANRRKFFDDLFAVVPAYPLTFRIARRAARVDGESRRKGVTTPFQDLVIGVTALEFDCAVATANVRHFQMIPNLAIVPL